jgi:ferredoxin
MKYSYQRRKAPTEKQENDRRIVLMGLSAALIDTTGLRTIPGVTTAEGSAYAMAKKKPAVPPGGLSQKHFEQFCTACHRCIGICPTHVLQPSFLEYGFSGILQPIMDFNVNYCNYDCTLCGEVCPTGAILPQVQHEKKLIQVGKVTFVKEDCIVETKKKDCGACAEHCPTKAVKMVPYGKLTLPEVDNQYCVGCGACEYACPTIPRKAIYVNPNPVHLAAKKREEKRIDAQDAVPEEFPF